MSLDDDARLESTIKRAVLGERIRRLARQQVDKEVRAKARAEEPSPDDEEFSVDEHGRPHKNQRNVRLALRKLGAKFRYDEFANRATCEYDGRSGAVDDALMDRLYLRTDAEFGLRSTQEFFRLVALDEARAHPYHPVRDYLAALTWDGVPRLDRWLHAYGGAADTEYARAVGPLPLIAAVRRVRRPGAKFDELLVLESPQGWDKSNALRALCPRDEWFSDSLPLGADAKHVIEGTAGIWIAEVAELQGRSRRDVDAIKAQLSRQVDGPVRLAYGRLPETVPRQFVMVGTTNRSEYLNDLTGARRFWPVNVKRFDLDALRRDRDQLWAEAAKREAEGESIRLDPRLWGAAEREQGERCVEDPWQAALADVLGDGAGTIPAAFVWGILGIPVGRRTQADNERLGAVMRRLEFKKTSARVHGKPGNAYQRGGLASPLYREVRRKDKPSMWLFASGAALVEGESGPYMKREGDE